MVNNLSLVYTASVPEVEIESFVSINSGLEKSQFSGDFRIENDEFNHPRVSERKRCGSFLKHPLHSVVQRFRETAWPQEGPIERGADNQSKHGKWRVQKGNDGH
ncbi:hypothetical protein [Nitrospira sp. Ecomares 2.1]